MLTGLEILRQRDLGRIVIDPLTGSVNPNSVNLRLHPKMYKIKNKVYDITQPMTEADVLVQSLERQGSILHPGYVYIGSTIERAGSRHYVPMVEGRSSAGRYAVKVHQTAGFGDIGFDRQWTLEIEVVYPIRFYPLIEICQISFDEITGEIQPYAGKYTDQDGPTLSRGVKLPDYEKLGYLLEGKR